MPLTTFGVVALLAENQVPLKKDSLNTYQVNSRKHNLTILYSKKKLLLLCYLSEKVLFIYTLIDYL